MKCSHIELYRAMTSYARLNPSQGITNKLKAFREAHGLKLEPQGTNFKQALLHIQLVTGDR